MKPEQIYFLQLLSAALWGREPALSPVLSDAEWKGLLTIARQQTVEALVADVILDLPASRLPSASGIEFLLQCVHRTACRTAQHRSVLAELTTLLKQNGIQPVLLKGLGLSRLYPHPQYRGGGDIDLYVGEQAYEHSLELLLKLSPESDVSVVKDDKHYALRYRGVEIELHRITESLSVPVYNRRFQTWTEEWLTRRTEAMGQLETEGVTVNLPPVQYNALYLFNHIWHHFCIYGIGIRQFCDWTLFLHHHREEINWEVLLHDLKRFGLLRPWQMFGCVAVDHLGLPEEEFPFYRKAYRKKALKILDQVFEDGNFGKSSPWLSYRPGNYLWQKVRSFGYWLRRLFLISRFSPLYATFTCTDYLAFGVKVVFQDLTGRK